MIFLRVHSKSLIITIMLVVAVYAAAMFYWLFFSPADQIAENVPGMDKAHLGADTAKIENIIIGEKFERFTEIKPAFKGRWPGFRGENRDNIAQSTQELNFDWSKRKPEIKWSVELGEGHAAPAIWDGLVYLLDYDEKIRADILKCFSLSDGTEIWRRWYFVHLKRNHGMSRTIPAVNQNYIVTIGPRCHVMCVERESGNFLWGLDLEKEYQTETPFWYTGQCPVIDNDIVILGVGGKSLLLGVDCKTGKIIWETPNPMKWKMSHSSIIKIDVNGTKMYVYTAIGGIAGILADGPETGKIVWQQSGWNPNVVAPTPLNLGQEKIFVTAGYGAGSAIIKISGTGSLFNAEMISKFNPSAGLASEQQTPILYNGKVYGILPKDAGSLKNQMVCYNPDNVTEPVWESGKTNRFGLGPYLVLDDHILILNDEGTLFNIQASSNKYIETGKVKLFEGQDAWGPMAFADGYLLLRDSKKMYCIDLSK